MICDATRCRNTACTHSHGVVASAFSNDGSVLLRTRVCEVSLGGNYKARTACTDVSRASPGGAKVTRLATSDTPRIPRC